MEIMSTLDGNIFYTRHIFITKYSYTDIGNIPIQVSNSKINQYKNNKIQYTKKYIITPMLDVISFFEYNLPVIK